MHITSNFTLWWRFLHPQGFQEHEWERFQVSKCAKRSLLSDIKIIQYCTNPLNLWESFMHTTQYSISFAAGQPGLSKPFLTTDSRLKMHGLSILRFHWLEFQMAQKLRLPKITLWNTSTFGIRDTWWQKPIIERKKRVEMLSDKNRVSCLCVSVRVCVLVIIF